jgi:hypothetical protein
MLLTLSNDKISTFPDKEFQKVNQSSEEEAF